MSFRRTAANESPLIPKWIKEREGKNTSHPPKLSKEQEEELKHNASPTEAFFSLGWACQQAGRYDEAVAAYRQVQSFYPKAEEAGYQTAMVHLLQGNREAALEQVAKMGKSFERRLDVESKLLVPELIPSDESVSNGAPIIPMTASDRPTILYREKAKYTEEARQSKVSGTVQLQVIFRSDGALVIQRVIEYLPMEIVESVDKGGAPNTPNPSVLRMDRENRPTILYQERAKYTETARQHKAQGTVVLSVVFDANEKITGVRIIRDLPYCLTAQALIAARKIKFKPAMKNGEPVSVRSMLEFTFNLY